MDEFTKRLKRDAEAIDARVPDELRKRIEASLQGIEPHPVAARTPRALVRLWWASSLAGLAAAVVVITVLNWNRAEIVSQPAPAVAIMTVPRHVESLLYPPQLDLRNANFADPLEAELQKLRADFEKARMSVANDLQFTF